MPETGKLSHYIVMKFVDSLQTGEKGSVVLEKRHFMQNRVVRLASDVAHQQYHFLQSTILSSNHTYASWQEKP